MAEGSGLLNRYTVESPYRGFESLPLRFVKVIASAIDSVNREVGEKPLSISYKPFAVLRMAPRVFEFLLSATCALGQVVKI